MTTRSSRILADALALPPTERAALVEEILSSFGGAERHEVDALWAVEAEDRIDAFERGDLPSSPAKDVFDRLDRRPAP